MLTILDRNHIGDLIKEIYTCDFENIVALQNVNWWIRASSEPQIRNSCVIGMSMHLFSKINFVLANPPSKLVVMKDIKSFWGYNLGYLKNSLGEGLRFVS